jgi:phytoene dehydrogenase-like protein
MADNSIIIIGAGFAGLSAGIYAQMNGYQSTIYEMGDKPGGLCTAWQRKGYTIDGCIHWLVGSSPKSNMFRFWQEVGIAQGRDFINIDEFLRYECEDGRTLVLYSDVDRLEKHLLEFSPADEKVISEMIEGVRLGIRMDQISSSSGKQSQFVTLLRSLWFFVSNGKKLQQLMKITSQEFANRFTNADIRKAIGEMWFPDFSLIFILFTLAYLHRRNGGYPIGGSMPMSQALEKRYLQLGGSLKYQSRVEEILVEGNRAVGMRLADGSEVRAGRVISAADGHATIFKMLGGKFVDDKVKEPYENWKPFPPLIFVGLGVKRSFADQPVSVSGITFPLKKPIEIADRTIDRLPLHYLNQDPTLAPEGKTSMVVMLPTNYHYWKELGEDKAAYEEKKQQIAKTVVMALDQRFPGLANDVEMVDVATPLTFERYTGNWQGSFEGWLITPGNAGVMMKPMSQVLPGLEKFYMCGQWVEPGGGLPTGVMSGRRLLQTICKEDKKKFTTRIN